MPILPTVGSGSILQDDNDTPHRAHIARDRMNRQARSPDLSPIETFWDTLCPSVNEHHPLAANLE